MCGGSGGSTTSVTQTSNLPDYVQPYVEKMLGQAQDLVNQPYQQYTGQQTAAINPLQTQGYQQLQQMVPSGMTGQAGAMAGIAATNRFTGDTAQQYMSPYMQNVVDMQKNQAVSDYARSIPGMGATAARAGGLGGTRQALVQAEGQRNLGNQLTNIQATGLQNAFQNAQNQFNSSQNQMLQGAQLLGNMGQQQYGQQMGIANAQIGAGQGLQNIEQQALNVPYQNWQNQVNYPYQQLSYINSLIRGLPQPSNIYKTESKSPDIVGQLVGAAAGGKAGGRVRPKSQGLGSLIGKTASKR